MSNHGARQLDYVPATIVALEEVQFSRVATNEVLKFILVYHPQFFALATH